MRNTIKEYLRAIFDVIKKLLLARNSLYLSLYFIRHPLKFRNLNLSENFDNFICQTYKANFNTQYELSYDILRNSIILRQRYLITYENLCFAILSRPEDLTISQKLKGPYANDRDTIILDYFAVSVLDPRKGIGFLTLSIIIDYLKNNSHYRQIYLECYPHLTTYYKKFGGYITGYAADAPYVYMLIDL